MNDWMVPEADVGRQLPARSRQGAVGRGARDRRRASTATSTWTATASRTARCPGVHPKGAYFTRGSGHNQFGGYTEDADEYQEVHRSHRPQDPARGARPCPRRSSSTTPGATIGLRHRRRLPRRLRRGARPAGARTASPSTTCACAASRSATRSRRSSTRTRSTSSSSRTATRSCAAC